MRIISRARLRQFWEQHPDAEMAMRRWYHVAEESEWRNLAEVRKSMRATDPVRVASGNTIYVFNVGGNNYRIVAAIHFDRLKVFILRVLTHREYDRKHWKDEL